MEKRGFLAGGGEMGQRMRSLDWSRTPVGAPEGWPPALRTLLRILLVNRFPMLLWWGPEYVQFYNDAYRPVPGAKHPASLGQRARDCWAEIWNVLGPLIDTPFGGGPATWSEDLELEIDRAGFLEETHFTVAYSPVPDETAPGGIGGVLATVHEISEKVVGERRSVALRDLGSRATEAENAEEACEIAVESLSKHAKDVPFALLYLLDPDGRKARLAASSATPAMNVPVVDLEQGEAVWPLARVRRTEKMQLIHDLSMFGAVPAGPWPDPPKSAVVLPIGSNIAHQLFGFLVAGLSARLQFDASYGDFLNLATTQIANAVANARAYEEERKRAEALAEIDRAKTAFFSNVSHEFRTPLTLMLGPLESMLARTDLREDQRETLVTAHRNSLRLLKLVNSLLDFSRIEAGRVKACYAAVDLAQLTGELASQFRSAMEAAGLRLVVDCEPVGDDVFVDREMWEKIVLNLLSNAFKFTFEGSVTVGLRRDRNHAVLTVADTGVGIPEHELPRIFERFHRVEGARGRTYEGTGIGLALIQELVKLHGGAVSATSRTGEGSTFTVSLPFGSAHLPKERIGVAAAQVSTAVDGSAYTGEAMTWLAQERLEHPFEDAPPPRTGAEAPRSRILVVDDNADMREHIRRLLDSRYEVTMATNGSEALDAALQNPPDLVLTDVMMPVLDGFELLKRLRADQRTQTVPTVFLSARAGEESRVEGLDAGADDYLVKPFTARELLARVDAHLSLVRMRRQADEARRLSEARLGLALQSNNMAAWEWDPVKDEATVGAEMTHIFGKDVYKAQDVFNLMHPEDVPGARAELERILREGGNFRLEYRVRQGAMGETTWLDDRAAAIVDANGRVTRVVGVVTDITARKTAEEEMRSRYAELERANSELEEFAYAASHDLQEPLRTVNIYTDLLLRALELEHGHPASQYARVIHDGITRMETLIQDLLAYARVVHREQDAPGPVRLDRSIQEALDTLQGLILESGATVRYEPADVIVNGDAHQLAQVVQNLISNSLKYRRTDIAAEIRIATRQEGCEWRVSVTDNGIGFEPQYADRIFGLFKRLHRGAYPGTGLGLAICKRVLERYRGRIWAHSDGPGKGASFTFTLPVADEPAYGG